MNYLAQSIKYFQRGTWKYSLPISGGTTASKSTFTPTTAILNQSIDNIMATRRWVKILAVASSAALASGTYYGFTNYRRIQALKTSAPIMNQSMRVEKMPDFSPTLNVEGPTRLKFGITLFQYCSCPFCCKTRAFLDYFGIKYDIVEVDPVFRKKISWSSYKKVPTLLAHSEPSDDGSRKIYQINDSSVIISTLGSFLMSKRTLTDHETGAGSVERTIDDLSRILVNYQSIELEDEDGKKKVDIPNRYFLMLGDIDNWELEKRESNLAEERRWRDWADSVLVHSLSPNIYRTIPEALQAFQNFSIMGNWQEHFTTIQRAAAIYMGSGVMWLVGKKLKKKYNLKEDVRESLYDNCRLWMKAIGKDRKFMGGEKPNLADLSVFGILSSIEGCTAFDDLLKNTNIGPWYSSVKECCRSHSGTELIQTI